MSDDQQGSGTRPKSTRAQWVRFGLAFGIGYATARIAGDAVEESLGWWGSLVVGTLVAVVAALVTYYLVSALQRRGDRT
jgi:hypothetical protein